MMRIRRMKIMIMTVNQAKRRNQNKRKVLKGCEREKLLHKKKRAII